MYKNKRFVRQNLKSLQDIYNWQFSQVCLNLEQFMYGFCLNHVLDLYYVQVTS